MNAVQQLIGLKNPDNSRVLAFKNYDRSEVASICVPQTNLTQLIRIFTNYARSHPEKLHFSRAELAFHALYSAFPCR